EGMEEREQPTGFNRRHSDHARSLWLPGATGDDLAHRLEAPGERIDAWPAAVATFSALVKASRGAADAPLPRTAGNADISVRISASMARRNSVCSDRPRGRAPEYAWPGAARACSERSRRAQLALAHERARRARSGWENFND